MTARRAGFLLALCLLFVSGCRDTALPPRAAPPPVRPAADTSAPPPAEMPFTDTLFTQYDADVLAALRPDTTGAAAWVEETLTGLTLNEKIGQLFIVDMPRRTPSTLVRDEAVRQAQQGAGGFLMRRVLGPEEIYKQGRRLQKEATVPLFMAADYERGAGRFANHFTELPSNMAVGATRDTGFAAAAGRLTAIESRAAGVNFLFAPVVDVNDNPSNPIINIRSYGEDPALVGAMAKAFVRAAEGAGLLTTLKHFPGHGNVSVDTHAEIGAVTGSRADLDRTELAPYRAVLARAEAPPTAVMSAHLWIQALDAEPRPATFSREVLTGLLRGTLGFDGLVVTDDVKMGALYNDYALAERVLRPLEAGADIVLTPDDFSAAVGAVEAAVESGRLSEERIDASVRRILQAKARAGLHRRRTPPEDLLGALLEQPFGERVAQTIADRSLTLLKSAPALPLREGQRVFLAQLSNYKDSESIAAAMDVFPPALEESGAAVTAQRFDTEPTEADRTAALEAARAADVVVLALYLRLQSGRGEAGLFPKQRALVQALLEQGTPVVLVPFGNPYAVDPFPEADAFLVGYDQTLATVRAAADVLRGRYAPQGRLPISLERFAYGSGGG